MGIRAGSEFIASLRDERTIYVNGERLSRVPTYQPNTAYSSSNWRGILLRTSSAAVRPSTSTFMPGTPTSTAPAFIARRLCSSTKRS